MKVYAKVSLKGESTKNPVDYEGELNPRWNFAVDYTVNESTVRQPGVNLVVKLMCKRTLGDRPVGEVKIAVKELFDMGIKSQRIVSYAVAGTPEGRLNLLVRRPSSSGWKTTLETYGFLAVVGEAMLLLGGGDNSDHDGDDMLTMDMMPEIDGGDHGPTQGSRDVRVEVCDGDVFYDAP